jgi:hypothetical protein
MATQKMKDVRGKTITTGLATFWKKAWQIQQNKRCFADAKHKPCPHACDVQKEPTYATIYTLATVIVAFDENGDEIVQCWNCITAAASPMLYSDSF